MLQSILLIILGINGIILGFYGISKKHRQGYSQKLMKRCLIKVNTTLLEIALLIGYFITLLVGLLFAYKGLDLFLK